MMATATYSQVGIGTGNPNANALLELDATDNKGGLLMPRVELVATDDASPLTAHVQGMTLYNTATTTGTNGVTPGYYYNDGSKWIKLNAGGGSSANAWDLEGNADTDPDLNFIGTTDNQPLHFRVNNQPAGLIESRPDGNIFFGLNAGNTEMDGTGNIGIGEKVLSNTTLGFSNIGIGYNALYLNSTGFNNLAIGMGVLAENTTGNNNIGLGGLLGLLLSIAIQRES